MRLERRQLVSLSSDKIMTTISICKWEEYQQHHDNIMTTERHQNDTKQEREKEKEINNCI